MRMDDTPELIAKLLLTLAFGASVRVLPHLPWGLFDFIGEHYFITSILIYLAYVIYWGYLQKVMVTKEVSLTTALVAENKGKGIKSLSLYHGVLCIYLLAWHLLFAERLEYAAESFWGIIHPHVAYGIDMQLTSFNLIALALPVLFHGGLSFYNYTFLEDGFDFGVTIENIMENLSRNRGMNMGSGRGTNRINITRGSANLPPTPRPHEDDADGLRERATRSARDLMSMLRNRVSPPTIAVSRISRPRRCSKCATADSHDQVTHGGISYWQCRVCSDRIRRVV